MSNLSTEYANALFDSIEKIAQTAIDSNNKFDRTQIYTIQAIIKDDYNAYEITNNYVKKEEGYQITSKAAKLKAYSSDGVQYTVGDSVYVLSPNNAEDKKIIIGKASPKKTDEKIKYVSPKDQMIVFQEGQKISNFIPKYVVSTDNLGFLEGDFSVGTEIIVAQGADQVKEDQSINLDYSGIIKLQDQYNNDIDIWETKEMTGDYTVENIETKQYKIWDKKAINFFENNNYKLIPESETTLLFYNEEGNISEGEEPYYYNFVGLSQNTFLNEGLFITANKEKKYATKDPLQKAILEAYWIKKDSETGLFKRQKNINDETTDFDEILIEEKDRQITVGKEEDLYFATCAIDKEGSRKYEKNKEYELKIYLRLIKGENLDSGIRVYLYQDSEYEKFFDAQILKTELFLENETTGQYSLKIRFTPNKDLEETPLYFKALDFNKDIFHFTEDDELLIKNIELDLVRQQIHWYRYNKELSDGWEGIKPITEEDPFKVEVNIDTTYDSQTFKCEIRDDKNIMTPIILEIPFTNISINTENKETVLENVTEIGENSAYRIITIDPEANSTASIEEQNAYVRDGNYWVYGEDNQVLDGASAKQRYFSLETREKISLYGLTWKIPNGNCMFNINSISNDYDKVYEISGVKARLEPDQSNEGFYTIKLNFGSYDHFDGDKGDYNVILYKDQYKSEKIEINNIGKAHIKSENEFQFGEWDKPDWLKNYNEENKSPTYYAVVKEPKGVNNEWEITTRFNPAEGELYYTLYKYQNDIDLEKIALPFNIEDQYYPSKNFNQIFCEIKPNKKEIITISKTLQFGKQENQGTKYRFNLVFGNERPVLFNEHNVSIKPVLQNDHGINLNADCELVLYTPFAKDAGSYVVQTKTNTIYTFELSGNDLGGFVETETGRHAAIVSQLWRVVYATAKVQVDGVTLTAQVSIPTVQYDGGWTDNIDERLTGELQPKSVWNVKAPREVLYSGSGQNPIFSSDAIGIYNKDGVRLDDNSKDEASFVAIMEEYTSNGDKITGVDSELSQQMIIKKENNYYLKPPSVFLDEINQDNPYNIKFLLYYRSSNNGTRPNWCSVVVPVFFRKNLYENSILNNWDGAFGIQGNDAFFANVAVGKKDYAANTITGVFMGTKKNDETYGLYGYVDNNEIFRITNNGEIFIGKQDLEGDDAYLNFNSEKSKLDIQTKNFNLGNNQNYYIKAGPSFGLTDAIEIKAENFSVDGSGNGTLGKWKFNSSKFYYPKTKNTTDTYSTGMAAPDAGGHAAFWAGYNGPAEEPFQHGSASDWKNHTSFYILLDGTMKATKATLTSANVSGNITASTLKTTGGGNIGPWNFNSTSFTSNVAKSGDYYSGLNIDDSGRVIQIRYGTSNATLSSLPFRTGFSTEGLYVGLGGASTNDDDNTSATHWLKPSGYFRLGPIGTFKEGASGIKRKSDGSLVMQGQATHKVNNKDYYVRGSIRLGLLDTDATQENENKYDDDLKNKAVEIVGWGGFATSGDTDQTGSNYTNLYGSIVIGIRQAKTKAWSTRLSISRGSGNLTGTWNKNGAAISTTSDANKKNSINPLSEEYSNLFDQIQPVTYKYNDGTSDRLHTGFIAQQIKESLDKVNISTKNFAGLVIQTPNTEQEQWYLRYEEFIALNTNEIQKLKKRVNQLETEVSSLKEQLLNI